MSAVYSGFPSCFVLILMIISALAQDLPPLGSIVPKIKQENFELTPHGNGYTLGIQLPDFSTRNEDVELINPGTPEQYLSVKGSSNTNFPGVIVSTTYTADKKGYVVHYEFHPIYHINSAALKAAAG